MQFASLGSGSKGNGTLVRSGSDCLLIDCGFSLRETEKRLSRFDLTASDLTAILVTHEHSDHLKGVFPLAKKYNLTVFITAGTLAKVNKIDAKFELVRDEVSFQVGNFTATPVAVPHDAKEPVQFLIECSTKKLGVLTDLGKITPHVTQHFSQCDGLVLEANHDLEMLKKGSYPKVLKQRVGGDWGHLNNAQALALLNTVELGRLQHLVLGHISEQNNSIEKVKSLMGDVELTVANTHYACQQQGFGWLELQ